ncbi:cell division topological specificity factor MinE [Segnochrobactrum spirostomi]|uniref:Cell division topological specificity factor n=1 Tax=Segnochrobactrum spirostomi TaxID=2608987 RepID=A0A6A7Y3M2_9HYPH|nr:cell division topological specificity factor MinE [Segnochrobactrum spirostomi]MQT12977.1 cell division topological specificity factor MinE [Segnochrobactrum spirostomi]
MTIFGFLRKRETASAVARDRLQILLSHERGIDGDPNLILALREEILRAIGKHVDIAPDKVRISMRRGDPVSTLEVEVDVPSAGAFRKAA